MCAALLELPSLVKFLGGPLMKSLSDPAIPFFWDPYPVFLKFPDNYFPPYAALFLRPEP
jgi:hypothetical protein